MSTECVQSRPRAARGAGLGLSVGALGVVFGDIGTSPLYAVQAVFSLDHGAATPDETTILGVVSMILWTLVIIVSIKYVTLVMRADNAGEGGVIALASLARSCFRSGSPWRMRVMAIGMIGAALFYGDGIITPAISVLSAVEGIRVVAPEIAHLVPFVGAVIVLALFLVQHRGTARIGRAFGPVMGVWFGVLAALAIPHLVARPDVLRALLPTYAVRYIAEHPVTAFILLGAVVLAVTGAEALYADMGHFGASAIRRAWAAAVLPALIANYLGQAALLLDNPAASKDPFFLLAPQWGRIPLVVLATVATVIASQAVITGAFSMTQQAIRYGLLPRVVIKHTSETQEGQIYIPAVNTMLLVGVLTLIAAFQSSTRLSAAYGLAVTGTFVVTTTLLLIVARRQWAWPMWSIVAVAVGIGGPEVLLFAANGTKFIAGGWLPVTIAVVLLVVMSTWMRGGVEVRARRAMLAGNLHEFLGSVAVAGAARPERTAVFLHAEPATTPLALRANVLINQVLHRRTVLVSIVPVGKPHVGSHERVLTEVFDEVPEVTQVQIRQGFMDSVDVPAALAEVLSAKDRSRAIYFVSRMVFTVSDEGTMRRWQTRLFVRLSRYAADPSSWFRLPPHRTVVMGTQIDL